jgi:hypothetical protein
MIGQIEAQVTHLILKFDQAVQSQRTFPLDNKRARIQRLSNLVTKLQSSVEDGAFDER